MENYRSVRFSPTFYAKCETKTNNTPMFIAEYLLSGSLSVTDIGWVHVGVCVREHVLPLSLADRRPQSALQTKSKLTAFCAKRSEKHAYFPRKVDEAHTWPVSAGLLLDSASSRTQKESVRGNFCTSVLVPHLSVPVSPDSVAQSRRSYSRWEVRKYIYRRSYDPFLDGDPRLRNREAKKGNELMRWPVTHVRFLCICCRSFRKSVCLQTD